MSAQLEIGDVVVVRLRQTRHTQLGVCVGFITGSDHWLCMLPSTSGSYRFEIGGVTVTRVSVTASRAGLSVYNDLLRATTCKARRIVGTALQRLLKETKAAMVPSQLKAELS